jgi:hypothetical protein
MDGQFVAVANATGAEWSDRDFYQGTLGHTPFLLKQTASEPPGCYFKFRKKGRLGRPGPIPRPAPPVRPGLPGSSSDAAWQDSLSETYAKAGVSCEVDDDEYVFLWIAKPQLLTPEEIAELARDCVRKHANMLPDQDALCPTCGCTGEATLFHQEASVTMICPRCLDQKQEAHVKSLDKLNAPSAKLPLLFPAALLAGSLAWAVFWNLWDAVYRILNTNELPIPRLLIMVLAVGFGFGAGWPVGAVLRRSGAISRFSAGISSLFLTLTIVIIGDLLYGLGLAYFITGSFDLGLALRVTLPFAITTSPKYAVIKFLFACTLGLAAYEFSKPKTKRLRI